MMLRTRGLTKRFGALAAVDGVDLDIQRGKLTSIIGPNGAGKSTLFNLISGCLAPDTGKIDFDGQSAENKRPDQLLARGLARSFQITNLFGGLSVRENVRLAAQANVSRWRFLQRVESVPEPQAKVRRLLDRFELCHLADHEAKHLSHGDQRRLEIAVCMASDPKLLMLDEPTQGMAHHETQMTGNLVRSLVGDVTILLIEHDIDLVMDVSDTVVVMHQGCKIAEGSPDAISAHAAVQDAYLGISADA